MELYIKELKRNYEAIDSLIQNVDELADKNRIIHADDALKRLIEAAILSQTSYQGMTNAREILRNSELDMRYIVGELSEEEMKEREEWHWKQADKR